MEACKICNSNTEKFVDEKYKLNYFFCENCGFFFSEEKKFLQRDDEIYDYEKHDNFIENEGYVKMFENYMKEGVDPFINSGAVLEFGCGHGPVLAELLKRKGFEVDVYDKFFFDNKEVFEKQYDLITTTEVFEHFQNPHEEIEKVVKMMKKGGLLSIMTMYPPNSSEAFLKWYYRLEKTHYAFYSIKTMNKLAEIYGLEIIFSNDKNVTVFKKK